MIRLLFISPTAEWGGPEAGLLEIVRNIDPHRFAASIVFPAPGPYTTQFQTTGATVYTAPTASLEKGNRVKKLLAFGPEVLAGTLRVAQIARETKADILMTNCSASIVGLLAARLIGKPHIALIREMWATPRLVTVPLYWLLYHGSDRILTVTSHIREATFGRYDLQKVQAVYDILDESWFSPPAHLEQVRERLDLGPNQPVICTVGRLSPQKGIHCFVEAAAIVHDRHPDAVFLVIGDVPRPRYQEYKDQLLTTVRDRRLESTIRFLGWRSDVQQLMAISTVNVLASVGPEGAPRVIAEGWAVGVPAVVPDHSGPLEMVRDGIDGFHFRTGEALDLAHKIDCLLSTPQIRAEMQAAGRQRARELFGAQSYTARIEAIWEQIVQGAAS